MISYDPYILDFIFQEKQVSLEKIGRISLTDPAGSVENASKFGMLVFEYDKKAETSNSLITFISEKTGKNKGLISSDISSYLEQACQFINIGKPFTFEGMGVFKKNNSGEYEFFPVDAVIKKDISSHYKNKVKNNNRRPASKRNGNKRAVMILALLIVVVIVGGLGWGAYKMFMQQKSMSAGNDTSVTTVTAPSETDTAVAQKQLNAPPVTLGNDSIYFKFIFEVTTSPQRAYTRVAKLRSYGDIAETDSIPGDTSMVYHLYIKQKLTPGDTTKMKDSLQKYFQRPITVKPL